MFSTVEDPPEAMGANDFRIVPLMDLRGRGWQGLDASLNFLGKHPYSLEMAMTILPGSKQKLAKGPPLVCTRLFVFIGTKPRRSSPARALRLQKRQDRWEKLKQNKRRQPGRGRGQGKGKGKAS